MLTQQQITDSFIAGPTPGEDSDNDGIPDSIENQFAFLNPNDPNDAALDQDNDGLDNLGEVQNGTDRKSTRQNSSHKPISYAVCCLKKKTSTPLNSTPTL